LIETLAAQHRARLFVDQSESVCPTATWAGMMPTIENVIIEAADGREHLTPSTTSRELHSIDVNVTVVCMR
jgi:hypothetical protein